MTSQMRPRPRGIIHRVRRSVYLLGTCLFTLQSAQASPTLTSDVCARSLALSRHLESNSQVGTQTVFFQDLTPRGIIVLTKPKGFSWSSSRTLAGPFTPQGDPRIPIALLGTELAAQLDFAIQAPEHLKSLVLQAPGALRIQRAIKRANVILKERNQEPITYLPVQSPFLNEDKLLDLSLAGEGDTILQFPFTDSDSATPHEVTFHIGAILYPRRLLARAHQINFHTRNIVKLLRERAGEFEGIYADYIQFLARQLLHERAYELDAGLADLQSNLGVPRMFYKESYRAIWPKIAEAPAAAQLAHRIDLLARPSLTPLHAVLRRVLHITAGVNGGPWWLRFSAFPFHYERSMNYGAMTPLTGKTAKRLKKILEGYAAPYQSRESDIRLSTSAKWLEELVLGLDQRIQEISAATREAS